LYYDARIHERAISDFGFPFVPYHFDTWLSLDETAVHVADYDFSVRKSNNA